MSDAPPPLTALRAFEAAARHLSFAKAADELHVTPAALSFQIKSLEDHLGTPVFHRLNRAVALTEAGKALAPGLSDGFDAIRTAWRSTRRLSDRASLTVTAGPSVTSKILAPRLYDFAQAHPEIELRFNASLRVLDLARDEIDLAIRYGIGPDDGLSSQHLMDDFVTPMMSPALAERYGTLDALAKAPLLHDDSIAFLPHPVTWPMWFKAAGITRRCGTGLRFSQADPAIDAAIAGGGVVLGRVPLASSALSNGILVAPFRLALRTEGTYRALHQKGAETRPQLAAFLDWIKAEAQSIMALKGQHDIVDPPLV